MNEAIKKIIKKLDELEIKYELLEGEKSLIMSLLSEETGISVRFIICTTEFDDGTYQLTIMTGDLLKVKNELELLKTLNSINWNGAFVYYLVSDEKEVHIRVDTITTKENVEGDVISFLREIIKSLEENYDAIMKSNWS